jgi:Bor protein/Prokaryotic membrane lipoprotein lipid attachment site
VKRSVLALTIAVALSGCYHATIETGLPPSPQTLEKKWASGWIYGLVPPSTIETMQRCPNGVAKVETQLSFTNQLVNFITFGIYTPMEIVVTCAAGGMQHASLVDNAADFRRAMDAGTPVWVDLRPTAR